jgi:hypothetical protein
VLTPCLLRSGDGAVVREGGKLRMWFAAAALGRSPLHTLHETTSVDGIHWAEPSGPLLENVYCSSVLKSEQGYQMWYADVSRRPWVIRHATSDDGRQWQVTERPAIELSQDWEAEVLVYPTVLKVDGAYLMWYGSYDRAVRRQTTAIGFAVSSDGLWWHKHPANPVLRPDPARPWESNYVGSGTVLRLADGSFRYWYASRKRPPFENLYFAINTARWAGPAANDQRHAPNPRLAARKATAAKARLRLPLQKGDIGTLEPAPDERAEHALKVLEVIDERNTIVRVWFARDLDRDAAGGKPEDAEPADPAEPTFVDLWIEGVDTRQMAEDKPARLPQTFRVAGSKNFGTTCGGRSVPALEPTAE